MFAPLALQAGYCKGEVHPFFVQQSDGLRLPAHLSSDDSGGEESGTWMSRGGATFEVISFEDESDRCRRVAFRRKRLKGKAETRPGKSQDFLFASFHSIRFLSIPPAKYHL